jgi:restriction endonuclease S subunit/uncharacterized protein YwgA
MEIMTRHAPSGWVLYRLGQLFAERREKVSDKDFQPLSVTMNGIVPQLDSAAKSDDGDNRKLVRAGDYVINSRSDRKGSGGVSPLDGSVSLISIVLEPIRIHPPFAHHLLRSPAFQEEFYRWGHGIVADLWTTRYSDMKNIRLYLPDLATQKQIADFLDTETARIDALIEKKQRFMDLVVEREEASFLEAVTGRKLASERAASGVDWIGDLPKGWLAPKFTQIARQETGHTPSRKEPSYWVPDECVIPWVSLADVWQLRSGETVYLEDTAEKISPVGMANSSARLLPKGTVILSRTASVGFAAIMATDMATTQDFAAWVPGPKVRSKFLYYVLRAMRSEFRRLMMGSTHQTIYMPDIRSFRTPLPPLAEQDRIIAALDASIGRYRQATAKIQASINRLREYRAALITAAVTGQIDVASHARPTETVPRRNACRSVPASCPCNPCPRRIVATVRVLVAADVVHRLGADPYLGRTKLQKLMFLAEAHANINDIAGRYQRYRYGPYDDAMVQEIELGLRQDGYYDTREGTGVDREKVAFLQMSRAGGHRDALAAALGGKTDTLRQLVDLFKGKDTEATEAVATLYAVWNDALIDGKQPDDAAIIRGFLQDWHPEKGKFKQADLQTWLGWMRRHGLVPKGTGPRTVSTNTPSLFERE